MALTVGSLFSGIGGLDLGLERAGMQVIWQSEIDPYANKILKKHWPEVVNHGNIKEINWETVERPNVICGGYPCQPFSTAGKRRGEEDPRHLWPWVLDAISRLRPDYAILENVRGHLTLGGLSVIGDLASIGYDAEWRVVSAASVGANHRQDRIIIVAYPSSKHCDGVNHHTRDCQQSETSTEFRNCGRSQDVANTTFISCNERGHFNDSKEVSEREKMGCQIGTECGLISNDECKRDGEHGFPGNVGQENQRRVYNGAREIGYDGWEWWATEPDVGRVAHGVSNRVDRLRGLGNAVVPQVAEVIGRLVVAHAQTI